MEYRSIAAYGLVGNRETGALVGPDGSVDWLPFPRLCSPSVFARVLDVDIGGWFCLRPIGDFESTHEYLDDTSVLRTTFHGGDGTLTLTDFMPPHGITHPETVTERSLVRRVTCVEDEETLDVSFRPRFDYARGETTIESIAESHAGDGRTDDGGIVGYRVTGGERTLSLWTDADLDLTRRDATGSVTLTEGESRWFVLTEGDGPRPTYGDCQRSLEATLDHWRGWVGSLPGVGGEHRDLLARSAVTMRLLSNARTGAIAAAPTTSLPEDIGGVRNWDYRFHWMRDSSIVSRALSRLGATEAARANLDWWLDHLNEYGPASEEVLFHPLYDLYPDDDTVRTTEITLDHLSGYRDSAPVRIGNAAYDQKQLDIYGELLLSASELVGAGVTLSDEEWAGLHRIVEHVCEVWQEPDYGIWEVRSQPEQFVNSKVMCWAAVDRGIELATGRGESVPEHWVRTREEIHETVCERGFREEQNAFVRSFEADEALDAACLRIPLVGFLPADDPRVQGTIDAIVDRLLVDDGLVQRYEGPDGLPGRDHAFVLCTFWLVDAMAAAGRRDAAATVLSDILDRGSSLGLFAEEIDPMNGEQLGNYPLAFAHAGLVNSVLGLTRAGEDRVGVDETVPTHHD
ncbi:glycoside hydrolase family 15 protein [Halomarina oriensis]|uniref:Glycoside hydrolase family 15 protein n=1 Tax=Halomarina oriensis TaxID=671145 RepID=A0A6B0GH43_9EURY|nr:glycoside hydrolase family 15 protein [Halomarina oriensis]MWG34202.1 glycoside hydrolase family 15 protein [Halomarina oriensis]